MKILVFLNGWGVLLLILFFFKFLLGVGKLIKKLGLSISILALVGILILTIFIKLTSSWLIMELIKELNKNDDFIVHQSSGLYISKEELNKKIKNSFLFKIKSGYHPNKDKFIRLSYYELSDIEFIIYKDTKSHDLYWLSVENILGDGFIGFLGTPP